MAPFFFWIFGHPPAGLEEELLCTELEDFALLEEDFALLEEDFSELEEGATLLEEGSGAAATILKEKGVTSADILRKLEQTIGRGRPTTLTPSDFTPRCKRILEMAMAMARQMGHGYVGTEHILMSIIQEGDSYAVRFLSDLGADPQSIFVLTAQAMGATPPEPAAQPSRPGVRPVFTSESVFM